MTYSAALRQERPKMFRLDSLSSPGGSGLSPDHFLTYVLSFMESVVIYWFQDNNRDSDGGGVWHRQT